MKKHRKILIFAAAAAAVLVLNSIFGWSDYITGDGLELLKNTAKENILLASAVYVAVTVVGCVALALPGVTFAVFAGLIFGPIWGTVLCSLATTIGAVLAFVAARYFLKDSVKPMAMKNKYIKKWLFDEGGKNQLFILMLTRLIPLFPYNLQNFAYGVTDIKLSVFTIGSLVFMLPGTAMYTIGTAGIADSENRWLYLATAAVLAVSVTALGIIFKKRYIKNEE